MGTRMPNGRRSSDDGDIAGRRPSRRSPTSYDNADKLTSVSQNGLSTTKNFGRPGGPATYRHSSQPSGGQLWLRQGFARELVDVRLAGERDYGYDADGRRTILGGSLAATSIPAPQTFSYNADNSLKTVGSSAVSNDNDGNLTCIAGNVCPEFSYDERGHLQQWVTNPYAIDYSYDAFGRRYDRNVGGLVSVCYQYDGLNPVATTFDCDSSLGVTSYLNGVGLDELFMVNNGTNQSFLRDGLNSTIALTDASGTIVDRTTTIRMATPLTAYPRKPRPSSLPAARTRATPAIITATSISCGAATTTRQSGASSRATRPASPAASIFTNMLATIQST